MQVSGQECEHLSAHPRGGLERCGYAALVTFASVLLLAVGLSMDATAVSAARGVGVRVLRPRHVLTVALLFGGSQALMPLLGWLVGHHFGAVVTEWDHWLAFVLLGGIGSKMLHDAWGEADLSPDSRMGDPFAWSVLALLALATSVDAFAAGVVLPILGAPLLMSLVTIGVTTALLSVVGLLAGRRLGAAIGRKFDIFGGLVLIGLGVQILVSHLSAN